MKLVLHPPRAAWPALLARPKEDEATHVAERVRALFDDVAAAGDDALVRLTRELDGADLEGPGIVVPRAEIDAAAAEVPEALRAALDVARANLETFHASQREAPHAVETTPGVTCWRRPVAIERVGLYVPGGTAPLFSTLLMLAVPARLAGCGLVVVATPPRKDGTVDPVVRYAAGLLGVDVLVRVGGAQAVAALATGTASVPKVDKIFGPGNRWVTAAKQLAAQRGVAVDLPAGPSEVLVMTDASATPAWVAADLLSQAEHGPDSQVVLLGTSRAVLDATLAEVDRQLARLPRRDVAEKALAASHAVLLADVAEMLAFSNAYAPEHLLLALADPDAAAEGVVNAGSVFVGHLTPEAAGDYASGTNHTLPTAGHARATAGVSLDAFVKKITFQRLTPAGLRALGPHVVTMAEAEGLAAHARAVGVRLEELGEEAP